MRLTGRTRGSGGPAIENGVPQVHDGQVQFAEGTLDHVGHALIADQPERGLETQPGGEQPADQHVVQVLGNPFVIFG
jgi:hypothetical protein